MKEREIVTEGEGAVNACEKREMLIYNFGALREAWRKRIIAPFSFDSYALGGKHSVETSSWDKELSGEMDDSNSNTYSRVVYVLKNE